MKTILLLIWLLLTATCVYATEWELIWSDEFNYNGLPDTTKWDYEGGFTRNEEMQYYTRRLENARVENGMLIIEARKELLRNPGYKQNSTKWRENREYAQYTSASLITLNKASFKYNRIEVRAKLPHGAGVWPAIWTLGTNMSVVGYPKCGEIDIMEYYGKKPNKVFSFTHYEANGKRMSKSGELITVNPYENYHVYAIEWRPDRIDFFFDDINYQTFSIDDAGQGSENPFRKSHYLLINLALGGSSGGLIDDNNLPQTFLIDYVRIYKQKNIPFIDGKVRVK